MAFILIGTDLVYDPAIENLYARMLRSSGFTADTVRPLTQITSAIEMIAKASGKIDVLVLAHHGSMSSSVNSPIETARAVRRISEKVSFLGAVRAKAVPIVAVAEPTIFDEIIDIDWFYPVDAFAFDRDPEALIASVFGAIEGWRQSLLQELEYVGYAVTIDRNGRLDVSHALVRNRNEGEILTDEATPGSLRAGQYLILAQDVLQEFEPYLKLKYLLNNFRAIAAAENIKPESVFQRFFEKNPHIIRRDLFDRHWSQPKLRIPGDSRLFLRPDFVMRPRVGAEIGTKWQVLDLKLPDDRLVVSQGFHAALSSKLTKAIQQLQNYREYFNRPDAEDELLRRFGSRPQNPKLAVLIGNRSCIEDSSLLEKAQSRYLDLEILTYDEIVDLEANRLALHSALARVL
jgi:hypothetical protein